MDITELHDEENLLVQMQDRWERSALPLRYAKNYGSLDAIVDTHDPFTLEGAPRFELSEKIDSLLSHALTEDENLLLRQTLGIPKGDACNKQERADQGREGTPAAKPDCPQGHEADGATGQCREAGQD